MNGIYDVSCVDLYSIYVLRVCCVTIRCLINIRLCVLTFIGIFHQTLCRSTGSVLTCVPTVFDDLLIDFFLFSYHFIYGDKLVSYVALCNM